LNRDNSALMIQSNRAGYRNQSIWTIHISVEKVQLCLVAILTDD
jgi:hypothetical protein